MLLGYASVQNDGALPGALYQNLKVAANDVSGVSEAIKFEMCLAVSWRGSCSRFLHRCRVPRRAPSISIGPTPPIRFGRGMLGSMLFGRAAHSCLARRSSWR